MPSIHRTKALAVVVALGLSVVSCDRWIGGRSGRPPGSPRDRNALSLASPQSPFIAPGFRTAKSDDLTVCLSLLLRLYSIRSGQVLRGELEADNRCDTPLAVLTAPVETRVRTSPATHFPTEIGINRLYAIAYIFRRDIGLGPDAFRGDGGLQAVRAPEYSVIHPGMRTSIAVTSGLPLTIEAGNYGLALFTLVAPVESSPKAAVTEIDLRSSLEQFNYGHKLPLDRLPTLAEGAVRLAPVAFFEVLTSPPPRGPGE